MSKQFLDALLIILRRKHTDWIESLRACKICFKAALRDYFAVLRRALFSLIVSSRIYPYGVTQRWDRDFHCLRMSFSPEGRIHLPGTVFSRTDRRGYHPLHLPCIDHQ